MPEEMEHQEEQQQEKTFTQAEVDELIGKRLARATRGMPTQEELTEFRSWKKDHQDGGDTLASLTSERDSAQSELEIARRENALLRKGVPADDVDYYVYKISKLVDDTTDFDKAAEKYFKENKRSVVRVDTGAKLGRQSGEKTVNDTMNNLLRKAIK